MARRGSSPDFSESSIARAVLRETVSHPLSIYPAVFAALGALAATLFGATPVLITGASGFAAVGLVGWLVNYFGRRQAFTGAYLARAHARIERETREKLEQLRAELDELGLEQGVEQVAQFERKLENLKDVLGRKLDVGELTYGRYLGIAEQVYLSAIDNLHEAALGLRAVHTIELDSIDQRLAELRAESERSGEPSSEITSLVERKNLYAEHKERVSDLLAQNEAAMTEMDRTAVAIAGIKTTPDHAQIDLETAMAELARLAGRAHEYSRRPQKQR
jgi:hypothetical protein